MSPDTAELIARLRCPPAVAQPYPPFTLDGAGAWLVMADLHLPYHDAQAIGLAVQAARKRKVVGVLIDGDLLDSHQISRFDKDPTAPRYVAEIEAGKALLGYLRRSFPKARIVFKEGNHDERLRFFLMRHAAAIFDIPEIHLGNLLRLKDFGVEHVTERRVIHLGRLNVIHGHEYPGGASSPVNPARGLALKAKAVALCGHHHMTSEHHGATITGKPQGTWSIGCLCQLNPPYMPLNNWNQGFALVDVDSTGEFSVRNHRIFNGAVV